MVLTRRQRKSGINVTPTAPEKKDTAKKKNSTHKGTPAKVTPTQEKIGSSELTSPLKSDGGINTPRKDLLRKKSLRIGTPGKIRKATPTKHTRVKSMAGKEDTPVNDRDREDTSVTDSNIEKSNFQKQNQSNKKKIKVEEEDDESVITDNSKELLTSNFDLSKASDEIGVDDKSDSEDDEGGTDVSEDDAPSKLEESHLKILTSGVKAQELVDELSDDEAPESMTFDTGRETALETLHQAYKESLKMKSKKKEKRRAHDTMMKEQAKKKMKRCEELDRNRLPETILNQVTTETNDWHKHSEQELDGIDGEDEDSLDDDEGDELFKDGGDDDYVKEKQGFQIVPLQKLAKQPVVKSMAASNFLQEQLYGKRVPRVTAPSQMSMLLKRSRQPAMNFKVKGLAVTKKERRQKKNNWANLIK